LAGFSAKAQQKRTKDESKARITALVTFIGRLSVENEKIFGPLGIKPDTRVS
jgi:hypothetical protein